MSFRRKALSPHSPEFSPPDPAAVQPSDSANFKRSFSNSTPSHANPPEYVASPPRNLTDTVVTDESQVGWSCIKHVSMLHFCNVYCASSCTLLFGITFVASNMVKG